MPGLFIEIKSPGNFEKQLKRHGLVKHILTGDIKNYTFYIFNGLWFEVTLSIDKKGGRIKTTTKKNAFPPSATKVELDDENNILTNSGLIEMMEKWLDEKLDKEFKEKGTLDAQITDSSGELHDVKVMEPPVTYEAAPKYLDLNTIGPGKIRYYEFTDGQGTFTKTSTCSNAENIIWFTRLLTAVYRNIDKSSVNDMYKNDKALFNACYGNQEDIKNIRLKKVSKAEKQDHDLEMLVETTCLPFEP